MCLQWEIVASFSTTMAAPGLLWPAGHQTIFLGVWGSSNSNVFAVGDSGTILHYDGISWSIMTMTDPITDKLNSVWGWSPTGVFALGDNGAFLIYNGSWSSAMSGVFSSNLNAIWGPNGGNIFMIGDGGLIGHWDGGATGGLMDSRTTENLKNICGSSGD